LSKLAASVTTSVATRGPWLSRSLPRLRLRRPDLIAGLSFSELGYAGAARDSYQVFAWLKRAGVLPEHCRFRCPYLPPLSPVRAFISGTDRSAVEPTYEKRLFEEFVEITDALPHDH
jgi:hypothetical protein